MPGVSTPEWATGISMTTTRNLLRKSRDYGVWQAFSPCPSLRTTGFTVCPPSAESGRILDASGERVPQLTNEIAPFSSYPAICWNEEAHLVQFYTEDSCLLDGLSTFIADALGAGESAIVVATETHRDGLSERLLAEGVDVRTAAKQGRYVAIDAAEALTKFMGAETPHRQRFLSSFGALIRKAESAAEVKGNRISIFGEMVAVLWSEGKFDAALQLEKLWNELARTHHFYLRCAYPASGFHGKGEPYATICGEHSVVIPAEG